MQKQFTNFLSSYDKALFNRLAEIEKEDEDICSRCGGEDCVCCEIYQDRKNWKSPEDMLEGNSYYDYY